VEGRLAGRLFFMENDMTDDDALIARLRDAIGIRRDGTLILTDEHVRTGRVGGA
jgi:hypothetical protein